MLFKKKENNENILNSIYKKGRLLRYSQFLLGVLIVAITYNVLVVPCSIVYGMGGVGIILNKLINVDPSLVILIGDIFLLILSYFLLGKEETKGTIIGSLLYPVFVKLTSGFAELIDLSGMDTLVLVLFGAVITGFGLGLIFKSGFTTGGTDVLNQIVAKYFKTSLGNSMIFTDGLIIVCGLFVFGIDKFMYSLISLYIISIMTDKVVLGISESKAFYIVTENETLVKRFITEQLGHGVTVLQARGGYTGDRKKVIMCIIPTKEYFLVKEGIHEIDPRAFFVVNDAYEVSGGA